MLVNTYVFEKYWPAVSIEANQTNYQNDNKSYIVLFHFILNRSNVIK